MRALRAKLRPRAWPIGWPGVEPARPGDAAAIGEILSDWIDATAWMPRIHKRADEQAFAAELVAKGWVTVARRSGRLAGFLARDGEEVVALYVAAGARGQGVGSALLNRAKRKSPRLALWTFQFNHAAQAFYLRHGFREIDRTGGAGNDEKLPDIRYLWERAR